MSTLLGKELPEMLLQRLRGERLEALSGGVILLLTVDSGGWPHPSMLSYFEAVALDSRRIRLGTYQGSRATQNMRNRGQATLVLVDTDMAYYVKGRVRELQRGIEDREALSKLELEVSEVLSDTADVRIEGAYRILDGIRFSRPEATAELRRGRELIEQLRS